MIPSEFVAHLRSDGTVVAAAATRTPEGVIPCCPGWDMTALVGHLGVVHRRVAALVERRARKPIPAPSPPQDRRTLVGWYREGLALLIAALEGVDPDAPVWNWAGGDNQWARFWQRRMALETAVHRWDAESSTGQANPIDAGLAADGIAEYLNVFVPTWLERIPVPSLAGVLHVRASDVEADWRLALYPDHVEYLGDHVRADAAVSGAASALLLWLWNRLSLDSPDLRSSGDERLLQHFRDLAV